MFYLFITFIHKINSWIKEGVMDAIDPAILSLPTADIELASTASRIADHPRSVPSVAFLPVNIATMCHQQRTNPKRKVLTYDPSKQKWDMK